MKIIRQLMAMTIAAVAFTACSDNTDNAIQADVTFPSGADGSVMLVEAYANDFTFDIKTDGQWRLEKDSYFFTVNPTEGTGNATVTVSVQNNKRSKRKTGHLAIVFPGHEELNKELTIEQKWKGENGLNAADLNKSNRIYAVGYGYDASAGLYANSNCLKSEIFNTSKLINDSIESKSEFNMDAVVSTVTGSSITELSNNLTVKASASGGFGSFKAEASSSFTMNYSDNSSHEYAINYLEATLYSVSFNKALGHLKTKEYMIEDAYEDINGLFDDYATTNSKGLENLIRDYGTHVVVKARLGGRIRQSVDVDVTDITTSYDVQAFAKASYSCLFAKGEVSVDEEYQQSYQENQTSININLAVVGGSEDKGKALLATDGFTEDNYLAWLHSVTADSLALIGFDEGSLVPLYELVDVNSTEFDGTARYNALKEYIDNGIAPDASTYDSGTAIEFDVPTFDGSYGNTLIKEINLGGELRGIVCNEYIPIIDRTKRVTVVYPVIGSTPRYNMGFFIGDEVHKPARVSWDGNSVHIVEYPDLDFGSVTKLYQRGASVTTTAPDGASVQSGSLQDEFLKGTYYNLNSNTNEDHAYPLVKIFGNIWTRTDYCKNISGCSSRSITVNGNSEGRVYYNRGTCVNRDENANNWPAGWRVPSKEDYQGMYNILTGTGGWTQPAKALMIGDVTGYDMVFAGWWEIYLTSVGFMDSDSEMHYWCTWKNNNDDTDKSDLMYVDLKTDGTFAIQQTGSSLEDMIRKKCIRLVKM